MVIAGSDTSWVASVLSVGCGTLIGAGWAHTFRFGLDPTVQRYEVLARHAGACRFAFNRCLPIVKTALTQPKTDAGAAVSWTGLDLINAFNTWQKTQAGGPVFSVDADGVADTTVTGLAWRGRCVSRCSSKPPSISVKV
jgi:putative transposase